MASDLALFSTEAPMSTKPNRPRSVLVCGGRDYEDYQTAYSTLDALHETAPIEILINGGAAGGDRLGRQWAILQNVHLATVDAKWSTFGKRAGPLRNAAMLALQPSLVVAFPGGPGTADMVRQARAAGVEVLVVEAPNAER